MAYDEKYKKRTELNFLITGKCPKMPFCISVLFRFRRFQTTQNAAKCSKESSFQLYPGKEKKF